MTPFHEFLRQQITSDGFSTEDTLVSFLPLLKQVIATHDLGAVAPLEGIERLQVDDFRIGFSSTDSCVPRQNLTGVRRVSHSSGNAIEVVGQSRLVMDTQEGALEFQDLQVGSVSESITQPVYLPNYLCWEHVLGHHDPTTDVFSLGLILASLACGLDMADVTQLQRFVSHRTNLFRLNSGLHPVLRARSV